MAESKHGEIVREILHYSGCTCEPRVVIRAIPQGIEYDHEHEAACPMALARGDYATGRLEISCDKCPTCGLHNPVPENRTYCGAEVERLRGALELVAAGNESAVSIAKCALRDNAR